MFIPALGKSVKSFIDTFYSAFSKTVYTRIKICRYCNDENRRYFKCRIRRSVYVRKSFRRTLRIR